MTEDEIVDLAIAIGPTDRIRHMPASPWRTVEAEGEAFLVRQNAGATWAIRKRDRAVFLYDVGDPVPVAFVDPNATLKAIERQGSLL